MLAWNYNRKSWNAAYDGTLVKNLIVRFPQKWYTVYKYLRTETTSFLTGKLPEMIRQNIMRQKHEIKKYFNRCERP